MKTLFLRKLTHVGSFLQEYGFSIIVLCGALLLTSCGGQKAKLRITECKDQDGTPLRTAVEVRVDGGDAQKWKPGTELTIPVTVGDAGRSVRVDATVEEGGTETYLFQSPDEYRLEKGETRDISLRFFKPYVVTIQALDLRNQPLRNVNVRANEQHIGTTNERGYYDWHIQEVETDAGPARAGTRFTFSLDRDGKTVNTDPVVIQSGEFSYHAEARLDLVGERPDDPIGPEEPTGKRTVSVTSNMPNVRVRFENRTTGEDEVVTTPGRVALTQGVWQWSVNESSAYRGNQGSLDTRRQELLDIPLERIDPPKQQPITVAVTSNPSNVRVTFKNAATGEDEVVTTPGRVALMPGPWQWSVAESATHHGNQGSFDPNTQSRLNISLNSLPPPPLQVPVTSDPPNVRVTFKNAATGEDEVVTTPGRVTLTPGPWQWSVAESTTHRGDKGTLDPSTQSRLDFTLEKKGDDPPPPPVTAVGGLQACHNARTEGDIDEASACYDDISNDGGNVALQVEATMSKGLMLSLDKSPPDFGGAISAFTRVLDLDASQYPAHKNLAAIHLMRQSYNEALYHLDQLLAFTDSYTMSAADKRDIELDVRYRKGEIRHQQFLSEHNLPVKQQKARLSRSVWQNFLDLVPSGDSKYETKKREAQRLHGQVEMWIKDNQDL